MKIRRGLDVNSETSRVLYVADWGKRLRDIDPMLEIFRGSVIDCELWMRVAQRRKYGDYVEMDTEIERVLEQRQ
jgi:hypothetical protein